MGILHCDIPTFCQLLPEECALGLTVDLKEQFDINLYCDLSIFLIRELSFFTRRGAVCLGGPEFLGWSKRGASFFQLAKGGTRIFWRSKREDQIFYCSLHFLCLGRWARIFFQSKRGDQNFVAYVKGGQKYSTPGKGGGEGKNWWPAITGRCPPPSSKKWYLPC